MMQGTIRRADMEQLIELLLKPPSQWDLVDVVVARRLADLLKAQFRP